MTQLTVGVLALQGSFAEHVNLLKSIKLIDPSTTLRVIQVRDEEDLEAVTALIIPGGESTAISLIAQRTKMIEPLRKFVQRAKSSEQGYSVWGTCAGMILLGEQVLGGQLEGAGTERFGGMDVKVVRNQWGRQVRTFRHLVAASRSAARV
jgi:5'-phosphate synthase pdxT subunit